MIEKLLDSVDWQKKKKKKEASQHSLLSLENQS